MPYAHTSTKRRQENKPSQVFRFDPLDEHLYCKLNGLAMDVSGGCQDDGANVITYTKSEDDNQRWEQHSIRTSAVGSSGLRTFSQCRFTSKMHGKAMGVRLVAKSGSADPGEDVTIVPITKDSPTDTPQWEMEHESIWDLVPEGELN